MMDQDTFLTTLYVMIDDFCQSQGFAEKHRPGPAASLSCSEVVTLAVFGQWAQFPSERAFYRYVVSHLRSAFPTLPEREQFNRLQRQQRDVIVAFSRHLVDQMQAQYCLYEALDSSGIPTRDAKRRGTGWLAGLRQVIETIYCKLLNTFRLARERPHALDGFQVRLAAKVALHNFCIWLNLQLGREPLAFADLLDW